MSLLVPALWCAAQSPGDCFCYGSVVSISLCSYLIITESIENDICVIRQIYCFARQILLGHMDASNDTHHLLIWLSCHQLPRTNEAEIRMPVAAVDPFEAQMQCSLLHD